MVYVQNQSAICQLASGNAQVREQPGLEISPIGGILSLTTRELQYSPQVAGGLRSFMFTHSEIWAALDKIAEKNRLSVSGLSKLAGLDPTSFNKSKRVTGNDRPRWPSTESLSKVLACTGTSLEEFASLLTGREADEGVYTKIPMIGLAQAGSGEYFDDAGFAIGDGWQEAALPGRLDSYAYALKINGDDLLPVYRDGDIIVISPDTPVRSGERIVARTHDGELLARVLDNQTANSIELSSLGLQREARVFDARDIDWMARIIWASQ